MIIPLTATIAASSAIVYTKYLLNKKRVNSLDYTVQSFIGIFLLLLPGAFFFQFPKLDISILLPFALLLSFACFWNLIFFRGLKEESLVESQLVVMLVPLFSAVMGFLFFADERNIIRLVLLAIGVSAILWAHINHHKLKWHHGSVLLLFACIMIAAESVLVKMLLPIFSVYWLYFLRISFIVLIFSTTFHKHVVPHSTNIALHILAISLLLVIQFISSYKSFELYGLVVSNLFLVLVPLVVGATGVILFNEPITKKKVLAALALLTSIIIAQFF